MKSIPSRAFLSRSFRPEFLATVSTVEALCKALDIETTCVDRASSTPPASEAIEMIGDVDFFIALCGREQPTEDGKAYLTSQSVRDEITMAASAKKNVVCFLEEGVELKGFSGSMFTYKKLENFRDLTTQDLFQLTKGIHEEKLKAVERLDTIPYATGLTNYYVPRSVMQVELKKGDDGLLWDYIIERTYVFEEEHRLPLMHSAFCFENHADCTQPPMWRIDILKNGAPVKPELEIVDEAPGRIEIHSTTIPYPTKGDTLLVRERYQSPFLNVIHGGQTVRRPLRVGKSILRAYDGNYITNRVELLIVRIKLPVDYAVSDMQPIVSTFSTRLDHLNESEMSRLRESKALKTDTFFDYQTFELRVDRPLYQYFYGLAWDVPKVTDVPAPVASDSVGWR